MLFANVEVDENNLDLFNEIKSNVYDKLNANNKKRVRC